MSTALSGPLLYRPDSDGVGAGFAGLPLDALSRIGNTGLLGIDVYFNHFHRWEGPVAEGAAGGWVLTDATGTSTIVYGDVREGTIVLTADATSGADTCLQLGDATTGKNFGYTVGKQMWCFARLQTSTVSTNWKFFMGFGTPTTVPGATAPTNGIFLRNGTTVNKLDLVAKEGSNSTAKTNQITLVAATYTVIGFYVDVSGNVHLYQDGSEITAALIAVGATGLATLTADATKTLQFMIDKKLASATLTLDWLLIGQEL
jgi:hypothetical protein